MPFVYPAASKSILEGSDFYRISRLAFVNEEDTVFGSLIPIDVGFNALAVGPDSGFDNYECYYPDPLSPGGIALACFSTGAPFIGAVAPDASSDYQDSNGVRKLAYVRPSRALILSGDGLDGDNVVPLIDVIAYTGKLPPALAQERSPIRKDGYFETKSSPFGRGHAIPGFGRKAFTATVRNDTAEVVNIAIEGKIAANGAMFADPFGIPIETELLASVAVASGGGKLTFAHDAVLDGYFDYYVVKADSASPTLPSDGTPTALFISMQVQD
jgi:hypothetical protein